MNKQRKVSVYTLLYHLALIYPGSTKVWVFQNTNLNQFEVGDTAVIQCMVHSDEEVVKECKFKWTLPKSREDVTNDILYTKKYEQRIKLRLFNDTFTTLTLKNLSMDDTDKITCLAYCFVDGQFTLNAGEGIGIQVSEKNIRMAGFDESKSFDESESSFSWINYLLIGINIVLFLLITFICISLLKFKIFLNK